MITVEDFKVKWAELSTVLTDENIQMAIDTALAFAGSEESSDYLTRLYYLSAHFAVSTEYQSQEIATRMANVGEGQQLSSPPLMAGANPEDMFSTTHYGRTYLLMTKMNRPYYGFGGLNI